MAERRSRSGVWEDLPPTSATPQDPRDRTVFSQALKTIRARPDGASLDEIKESFREIDLYHHDPLKLLRWQHDNRGWGFRMNPQTRRITIWEDERLKQAEQEAGRQRQLEVIRQIREDYLKRVPAEAKQQPEEEAARHQEIEQHRRLLAEIEQQRTEAQAERRGLEEERAVLERTRRTLEEERQRSADVATSASSSAPSSAVPEWLLELPEPDRSVFRHLSEHGSINEEEATRLLGGPRHFRRFSVQFESHVSRVPFKVRIETSGSIKCYVRDESREER